MQTRVPFATGLGLALIAALAAAQPSPPVAPVAYLVRGAALHPEIGGAAIAVDPEVLARVYAADQVAWDAACARDETWLCRKASPEPSKGAP